MADSNSWSRSSLLPSFLVWCKWPMISIYNIFIYLKLKKYPIAEILLIVQVDKWIPRKPFERTEHRDCIILSVGKGYVIYIRLKLLQFNIILILKKMGMEWIHIKTTKHVWIGDNSWPQARSVMVNQRALEWTCFLCLLGWSCWKPTAFFYLGTHPKLSWLGLDLGELIESDKVPSYSGWPPLSWVKFPSYKTMTTTWALG